MAAPMSFEEMCDKAAVHPTVRMLFKAKGVDVPGVLHHLFADRAKVPVFLEPLRAGVELQGNTKRRSADEQATVLELLDVIAAIKTAAAKAAVPSAASAPAAASAVEKSQELPAGYWNDFVTDYEAVVVDGRNRTCWWASSPDTSRRRSMQVNPYSSTTKPELSTKLFAAEDGTLSFKVARTIPEPQRLVTMLDSFEANKFAFLFAR